MATTAKKNRLYVSSIKIYAAGSGSDPDPVAVTGVSVAPATLDLTVGDSQQLTATVSPVNATVQTVTWSTGNAAVATVATDGTVTAVGAGRTSITATTTDGGFTSTSDVTVTAAAEPPASSNTFQLVNSTSSLSDGDKVILVAYDSGNYYAAGAVSSSALGRVTSGFSVEDDIVTLSDGSDVQVLTLSSTGTDNQYYLYVDNTNKLSSGTSTAISTVTTTANSAKWTISFSGNNAQLRSAGDTANKRYIQLDKSSNTGTWKHYVPGTNYIYGSLYKMVSLTPAAPTSLTITKTTPAETWQPVEVIITNVGGYPEPKVTYSINDGDAQAYSGPFTLNDAGSYTITASSTNTSGTIYAESLNFTITERPQVEPSGVTITTDPANLSALRYNTTVTVTMTIDNAAEVWPADAHIYYTLDGTTPTASSTEYTGPFKLTGDALTPVTYTINALAQSTAGSVSPGSVVVSFPAKPDASDLTYYRVTDLTDIQEGEQYVLAYINSSTITLMGAMGSNTYYSNVNGAAEFGTDVSGNTDETVLILKTDKVDTVNFVQFEQVSNDNWVMYTTLEGGYMNWKSASNASVEKVATSSAATTMQFSLDTDDKLKMQGVTNGAGTNMSSYYFQYNASSPRFGQYKSLQDLYLYKKMTVAAVPSVYYSLPSGTQVAAGDELVLKPTRPALTTKIVYETTHNGHYTKTTSTTWPITLTFSGSNNDIWTVRARAIYDDGEGNEVEGDWTETMTYTIRNAWRYRKVAKMEDMVIGQTYILVWTNTETGDTKTMGNQSTKNTARFDSQHNALDFVGDVAIEKAGYHDAINQVTIELGQYDAETGTQYYAFRELATDRYIGKTAVNEPTIVWYDEICDNTDIAIQFDAGRGNNILMPFRVQASTGNLRCLEFNLASGYYGGYDSTDSQHKDVQLYSLTDAEVLVPSPVITPDSGNNYLVGAMVNATVGMEDGLTLDTDYTGYVWTTDTDLTESELRALADSHQTGTPFVPTQPGTLSVPATVRAIAYLDVTEVGAEGTVTRRHYSNMTVANYALANTKQLILNRAVTNPALTKADGLLETAENRLYVSINGQTSVPSDVKIYYAVDLGEELTAENYLTKGTLYDGPFNLAMSVDAEGRVKTVFDVQAYAFKETPVEDGVNYLPAERNYEPTFRYHHFDNIRDFLAYVDAHDVSHSSVLTPSEFAETDYTKTGKDDYTKSYYIINEPMTVTGNFSVSNYGEDIFFRDATGGLMAYKDYVDVDYVSNYKKGMMVNGLIGKIDFSPRGATRMLIEENAKSLVTIYETAADIKEAGLTPQDHEAEFTTVQTLSEGSNLDNNARLRTLEYIDIKHAEEIVLPGDNFYMLDAVGTHSGDTPFKVVLRFNNNAGELIGSNLVDAHPAPAAPAASALRSLLADGAVDDFHLHNIEGIAYNNVTTNMILLTEEPEVIDATLAAPAIYTNGTEPALDAEGKPTGRMITYVTFSHPLMDAVKIFYAVTPAPMLQADLLGMVEGQSASLNVYVQNEGALGAVHLVAVEHDNNDYISAVAVLDPNIHMADQWKPNTLVLEEGWWTGSTETANPSSAPSQALRRLLADGTVTTTASSMNAMRLNGVTTALDTLESAGGSEARAEYYNLQGIRLGSRPAAGTVCIERLGGQARRIVVH